MSSNDFGTPDAGPTIKESVHRLADQGGETAHVIKDRATEAADQIKRQWSGAVSRSADFIQARPITSVGIAVGLGFLSRTLFRVAMIAGAGLLIAKLAPMVPGDRAGGGDAPI